MNTENQDDFDSQNELEQPESVENYELFLEMFTQNREHLYRYIFAMLPHQADAEDVFQRCSLVLWRKFSQYEPHQGAFLNWACGVAHYEVRNFLRTSKRDRHYFSPDLIDQLATSQIPKPAQQADRLQALQDCLSQLKEAERVLLEQAHYHHQSAQSLAEEAGKAVQTVYNQLNMIRRKLFQCVQGKLATTNELPGGTE